MELNINEIKERHGSITGKKDSMYMYILFKCTKNQIIEHISKQLKILERIADLYKKNLFCSKYHMLRDNIDLIETDEPINQLILIENNVTTYQLKKEWIALLSTYHHQPITYQYDDHFDMKYLEDLFECNTPYQIFRVDGDYVEHQHLTLSKKRIVVKESLKNQTIGDFVKKQIMHQRYFMYGQSSKLKGFADPLAYQIIPNMLKDEEMISILQRIEQEDILDSLEEDLKLLDRTERVVFKKEIQKAITNGMLEKLYIDKKILDRFMENMKRSNQTISFKLIPIDTTIKSLTKDREQRILLYDGVAGILYY
jgi:hypothetical protein